MKTFSFRLQPLLKLRRQTEDQKKRVVGDLLAQINEQQQQALHMAETMQNEGLKLKKQYEMGTINLEWVSHYYRFITHTQEAINQRIVNVGQIQKKLNTARQDLSQAAKDTKILEKLRDKQQERYHKKLKQTENSEQDEIAANTLRYSINANHN